jgi:VWFA-related protein
MVSAVRSFAAGAMLLAIGGVVQGDAGQQPQSQPPAQQTPAQTPGQQPPQFRTGINFVRVDVIVSDKQDSAISDLKETDFDVTEDGKPQKIESFKLVKLDGGVAAAADGPARPIRTDYDEESEASRDDVRLFAIFLDDYHVRRGTSMSAREPLARWVERQLGPTDMVGIMYPMETVDSVRMSRNHDAISKGLRQFLGRKFDYTPRFPAENEYANYPAQTVEEIRNQVSLSALRSLIVHLGSLKEGRKSLILVSEGYSALLPPQLSDPIASMPGFGNPNRRNPNAANNETQSFFSSVDMLSDLREIYSNANHYNVSIYTVDPRGLTSFEYDINEGIGLDTDKQYLNSTMDTLRVLADQTDGRAIVNRNDLEGGMKQIVKDSSAYYLLGYNSSQAPSDGKFHEIKVKVKRPGVQVRARKGYWALTPEETRSALAPPAPSMPKPVEEALASVEAPSRARVIREWIGTTRGDDGRTKVTYVWEPVPKSPGDRPREEPARVALTAVAPDGSPYFRGRVQEARVSFDAKPGPMELRVSVEGSGSQVLDAATRTITVPDLTSAQTVFGTPEVFRARTVREFQQLKADAAAVPMAGREFSRTDRLLIRLPAYGPANTTPALTARLLNRAGQPMADVPVTPPPDGKGEAQIDLSLAAFAPASYVIEIKASGDGGDAKELIGFRVTG